MIEAGNSYDCINGGDGNDILYVSNENNSISNTTLVGESGFDRFHFVFVGDDLISADIADFNMLEDNLIVVNSSLGSFSYGVGSDGLTLRDSNNRLKIVFNDIYEFEQIAGAQIEFTDVDIDLEAVTSSSTKTLREVTSNYYYEMPTGLTKNDDELTVGSEFEGGLWLYGYDIFNGRSTFADMSVTCIDASDDTTAGRILTGNSNDNWIYAGTNGAQMWGAFGDDWSVGGDGADTFWYGKGEGTDAVLFCDDNDLVNLYSFALEDITYLNINDNSKIISVGDEDGRLVIGASTVARSTTIQLSDGSRWNYSYNDRNWSYASEN